MYSLGQGVTRILSSIFIPTISLSLDDDEVLDKNKDQHHSIAFQSFIQPFTELLARASLPFRIASRHIANYCGNVLSNISLIFSRIIFAPSFDPTHPSFQRLINQFEEKVPILQERINQLEQKFWQNHYVTRDMAELKKLHTDISQGLYQLTSYANALEPRQHPFPIQDQLVNVRNSFKDLNDQMDMYCLEKGEVVLGQFQTAVNVFTRNGIDLPMDIRQQLITTWNDLEAVFKPRLTYLCGQLTGPQNRKAREIYAKLPGLREVISGVNKKSSNESVSVNLGEPLKLRNIGNSCYLDSVLQAFLCIDSVREQLRRPLIRDPHMPLEIYQKKLAIQQEILQFMDVQQRNQKEGKALTQMEFILFLLDGPSLYRLREAIFKSHLHYDLDIADKFSLTSQHDASNVVEIFIENFLTHCKFKWQGHAETKVFPGLEFLNGGQEGRPEDISLLQVPLSSKTDRQRLDLLIRDFLGRHIQSETNPDNQRTFDPKDAIIIPGREEEAARVINASATNVDEFREWYKLKEVPSVMVIQFKRYTATGEKNNEPVSLPSNGILDLTPYYDPPAGEPRQARYKIKSIIRHHGSSIKSGHYVAEVEINGKYYHCDDTASNAFNQISKTQFLGYKDPYFLFLERIPERSN